MMPLSTNNEGIEMSDYKRVIEINGVKVEIDLRTAKRVDEFRVGDKVKLLRKSYSGYESHYGVLIGFDGFKTLPTMIVAYLTYDDIKFEYINEATKDAEICHMNDDDFLNINATDIIMKLEGKIKKFHEEINQAQAKIDYLIGNMGKIFKLNINSSDANKQ
jgi:hypothetical protein